jgi:putative tryptophan/tyrosine transport system substrate-binding protein
MRRRDFIAGLTGTAAMPLAARAQTAMPVIGFLNGGSSEQIAYLLPAFRHGLSENGYVEGRNVVLEYRWAEGDYGRLPSLADDLVNRRVGAIAAFGNSAPVAKAATSTIPIVFQVGAEPVAFGLVPNIRRPGGNITGVTDMMEELIPKRIELLHELLPGVEVMAALINPLNFGAPAHLKFAQAGARALGMRLHILNATSESDFDRTFEKIKELQAGALLICPDPLFGGRSKQLADLTGRHAVPTISGYRQFVSAGGLMYYGDDIRELYRLVGVYIGRILKGENPGDLPVVQSTKVELVINLKTAKTFGLSIPLALRARANEVVE